ncbi:PREDICTED: probable kinetochore protein NUF2 [Camelina sativa]|uniref:Probable kinetochore protein NUF2 n=1 Tax=Camelina sativa TaxID=90675 RepID=A0ABM0ZNI9_CAMSA|nr:PREDICTED: probable kinetochore protein NUF2 [Camelina sativa]
MSAYEYPRLSRPEIITALKEAQIASITDADFKNPTLDFVSDLYTRLLIYLDPCCREETGQVDFEALQELENPDHHVTSLQYSDLYCKVKDMLDMVVACPLQMNYKDLIRPEPSRTEFFISSLMNYALHRDSKMNKIQEKAEELTLLDEERKQSEATIAQLNAEIGEFDEAAERDLPFVQELEARIEELNQTILALNNQQMSLRATFQQMRDKSTQMDNEISKAEFDLVQTVQENANLRSQIVQSPDKLQGALEEKKLVLGDTKKAEQSAMETFQEKAAILEVYEKAFKKISKSSSQLQLINEQVTNAKAVEKEVKALKAKLSEDGMYKSLEAEVVERDRIVEQLNESLKQLEKEKAVMFDDWTNQLNNLKVEVESRRRELEARQTDVESVVAVVDDNTAKIKQVRQSGEAKVQQLAAKHEEIVNQFREYTASFDAVLTEAKLKLETRERENDYKDHGL